MAIRSSEIKIKEYETTAGVADRREKHIEIDHAIDSIDDVYSRVLTLLDRITQTDAPRRDDCEKATPSLANVLSNAPDDIRRKCDSINDLLNQIESNIF